jgi:DNA-binding transcriptional ArsR family regulator
MDAGAAHVSELQFQTLRHLRECAQESQTLIRSARALGIDNTVLAPFEGKASTASPTRSRAPARARTRPRTRGATNGTQALTAPKILAAMREHPGVTRKQLAEIIGVSDTTLARQMAPLEKAGQIRRDGQRSKTKWFAAEPVAA